MFLEDGTVIGIAKGQMEQSGSPVAGQYIVIPFTDSRRILPELVGRPGCPDEEISEIDPDKIPVGDKESIDIIAVVDDSSSMAKEQKKFFAGFKEFLSKMDPASDLRICLLTTDVSYYGGNEVPWVKKHGNEIERVAIALDKRRQNFESVLNDTFESIGSEWSSDEQGIKQLNLHIRFKGDHGCLRQKGILVVFLLSDENERSTGGNLSWSEAQYKPLDRENYPQNLLESVEKFLPQKVFIWNSIIVMPGDTECEAEQDAQESPSFYGTLYQELSQKTDGYIGSICQSNFKRHFEQIEDAILNKIASVYPEQQ